MSNLTENRGTWDDNLLPYEFNLDNPDIKKETYQYYGTVYKRDHVRRGHGITVYHNKSILDAWWLSNKNIEPSKPVFFLGSYPKKTVYLNTNTSNPIWFINKQKEGYLLSDEFIAYGKFGENMTLETGYLLQSGKFFR